MKKIFFILSLFFIATLHKSTYAMHKGFSRPIQSAVEKSAVVGRRMLSKKTKCDIADGITCGTFGFLTGGIGGFWLGGALAIPATVPVCILSQKDYAFSETLIAGALGGMTIGALDESHTKALKSGGRTGVRAFRAFAIGTSALLLASSMPSSKNKKYY